MLIGINGQLGSGKDTVYERATALARSGDIPTTPERRAFADKLKQAVSVLLMISREFMEVAKRSDQYVVEVRHPRFKVSFRRGLRWTAKLPFMTKTVSSQSIRSTLQRMGAEVGRELFGELFWVDQCLAPDLKHDGSLIMVTDVRYPNEIQRVKDLGGVVVRVLNGPLVQDGHSSEQIIPEEDIDFEVDNSIRGDGFASLDQHVRSLVKATKIKESEVSAKKVNELPTRRVDAVLRGDGGRLIGNFHRGPAYDD